MKYGKEITNFMKRFCLFLKISRAICLHNLNELDDSQRDPIELQKLLNHEKVSDLISRIK